MTTLRAPFPWFGGKSRAASLVWSRFGDVPNYVEPFFGSGAVLLARPHAPKVETVNDADCYLANFWRALQHDPEGVAHWADWPVNEADLHARHLWLVNTAKERVERLKSDPDFYDVKIAGWWVWGLCQWIGTGWCETAELRNDGEPRKKMPALGDSGAVGRGIHAQQHRPPRKLPHLGDAGRGLHRPSQQLPDLGGDSGAVGRGIHASAFERKTGGIYAYFQALADRLRRVRVVCGNWDRVLGHSVTDKIGVTGVFLDPPYSNFEDLYAQGNEVAQDVREWAIANGDNPKLRIALCGYEGEHEMPDDWECVAWKAPGGYAGQRRNGTNDNGSRERIWFSPHCLKPAQGQRQLQMELIV